MKEKSEQICNEIGAKFFCKDYVYENLKYFNAQNKKVELCDALFEYSSIYVPIQIKARSIGTRTDEAWLNEVVYGAAVNQIKATVEGIRTNSIRVNDFYHQPVVLNKSNPIFPMIVFDNSSVKDYKRVVIEDDIKINIFKIEDYKAMMNVIIHPYDIIYYLQERIGWIQNCNLPNLAIGEHNEGTVFAKISSEEDFAMFFKLMVYNGDEQQQTAALKLLSIIGDFRVRQLKKNANYKTILNILQLIEPSKALAFMERFEYAWNCACEGKFDYTKMIQLITDTNNIGIVFCSVGRRELRNRNYYQVICDAKQLQKQVDTILLIAFIGEGIKDCKIDWVYANRKYKPDYDMLEFYNKMEIFSNRMNLEEFEALCDKLFGSV